MGTYESVTILGEAIITKFSKKHPNARKPLSRFVEIVKAAQWNHMMDIKAVFSGTDYDADAETYIFDIGGNKYRLLAAIDFDQQFLSIESVLTHEQYNRR